MIQSWHYEYDTPLYISFNFSVILDKYSLHLKMMKFVETWFYFWVHIVKLLKERFNWLFTLRQVLILYKIISFWYFYLNLIDFPNHKATLNKLFVGCCLSRLKHLIGRKDYFLSGWNSCQTEQVSILYLTYISCVVNQVVFEGFSIKVFEYWNVWNVF